MSVMERRTGLAVAGVLAAGMLIVGLQWHAERVKRRAILALPAAERAALVAQTRSNVETLCRDDALATQCAAEVRLLVMFPECDAACRDRVAAYLPQATR